MTTLALEQIRRPNCTKCELHKSSVNVCVMGKGNPNAKIMLVGEAPGEAESRTGKPFMGAAGQVLDEWLGELGLTDKVYITNVCKCRPPQNRKPTKNETFTCGGCYLRGELNIIKPQVLVLLGRTAIDYFFEGNPFRRGKTFSGVLKFESKTPVKLIPTWHPSYFNRLGGNKTKSGRQIRAEVIQSLSVARSIVDEA